jgi:hypothetical protein
MAGRRRRLAAGSTAATASITLMPADATALDDAEVDQLEELIDAVDGLADAWRRDASE